MTQPSLHPQTTPPGPPCRGFWGDPGGSHRLPKDELQFQPLDDIGETPGDIGDPLEPPPGDTAGLLGGDTGPGGDGGPRERWFPPPSAEELV